MELNKDEFVKLVAGQLVEDSNGNTCKVLWSGPHMSGHLVICLVPQTKPEVVDIGVTFLTPEGNVIEQAYGANKDTPIGPVISGVVEDISRLYNSYLIGIASTEFKEGVKSGHLTLH